MTHHILVVEDEDAILLGLEDSLGMEGYHVLAAKDGPRGLELALQEGFDLIILDLMLPGMNGFDVCREIRRAGVGVPILMLTAKHLEADKVLGLELGADDYVTKPFSSRELLARVHALLRRAHPVAADCPVVRCGALQLDFRNYTASKNGAPVHLTVLEFAVLRALIRNQGSVVSRDDLLVSVWGGAVYVNSKTVDTHIAHLRKKIEDDPSRPRLLLGVRGIGYKFVTHPETNE